MKNHPTRHWALFIFLMAHTLQAKAGNRLNLNDPDFDRPQSAASPVAMFWKVIPAALLGSALIDVEARQDMFSFRYASGNRTLRGIGDKLQFAGPAIGSLLLFHGMASGSAKSRETAYLAYTSFLVAGGASGILKATIGRERPSGTRDAGVFRGLGGDSSFPSGHTTTAFAAATVFAEQYPKWYVAIPAYTAASAVAYSRVASNQHWVSDVVAGAALGYGISHLMRMHNERRKETKSGLSIAPAGDGVSVGYSKEF